MAYTGNTAASLGQTSQNMGLLGTWDDNTLPIASGIQFNDIWGYETNGREFAIMGSRTKVHFIEVTDPNNLVELAAFAHVQIPFGEI
ncbi:MAG: hypothetical protein R2795_08650 [Saprospiraceae bacterium]